jgi:urease accessory protein
MDTIATPHEDKRLFPLVTSGRLHLAFDLRGAQTQMHVREQHAPLKVVRAFAQADGAALVHLHNVSGGVLAGDKLEMQLHVGRDARVQLTSTSATRLYRQRGTAGMASQTTCVQVDAGGLIEYVPDPIIPFAHSHMQQHTHINLAEDAGLFWWEIISPGRAARGERFAYDELELKTQINACGSPIAIEQARLRPAQQRLGSPAQLGVFGHYATFYVCRIGTDALKLETTLSKVTQHLSQHDEVMWGVSALPAHGVAIRGLAHTSRALMAGLMQFWQCAKQMLYGRPAIAPRKTY